MHARQNNSAHRSAQQSLAAPLRLILLAAFCLIGASCSNTVVDGSDTQRVVIGGRTFHLELALDDESRWLGLSHREEIAEDGGMLFVFTRPKILSFVMRDCLVPIDLIYLGPGGEIVRMHRMEVEPPETRANPWRSYSSGVRAQFAIELRGGMIDELGLQRGQSIELPFEALKQRAR